MRVLRPRALHLVPIISVLLAALLVPLGAGPAAAANTASISGKITVPAGEDVTKVRVSLRGCTNGECIDRSGNPGGDSSYSFTALPASNSAGLNGVPANAAGIWANLTVTEPYSFVYLTGYASGSAKPKSSNVNYAGGQTVPNLAYLPIGPDGKVTIANTESGSGSTTQIIADVSGYTLK
ncbi:hypothetical protein [Arthrobacter sp. M4]|uniref:hypothetical protein n=1 Tax=Arthrobacter sp. M4 TaxID=218160 RepID=UPI001CDD3B4C|nr:hypothetical protein [Arthrobacter sp. M4]MCA4132469.1 hypothetical protein [Arthrobacter sp. M4]